MAWLGNAWRNWTRRERAEQELDEEVRAHAAMLEDENVAAGMSAAAAHRRARVEMEGIEQVKESTRAVRAGLWPEQLAQDAAYAVRVLRRSPGFTAVAALTLMLGIGANTAIFSVVDAVLLRPLPYPHPEQLVTLHMRKPNFDFGAIPFPNFRDWQAQNSTFSAMALSRGNSAVLTGNGEPEYLQLNFITSDFFRLLGVSPALGRDFAAGEDDLSGPAIAMISEGFWKRRFGAGRDVLGKTLALNGHDYTVVGVVPASFAMRLGNFEPTDIYLPMGQWKHPGLKNRGAALGLHGIGRLKPGVTLQQARADMDAVSRNLERAYPDVNKGMSANMMPFKQWITAPVRSVLLLLLGATGFVLLIACVNVAGLMLARAQARSREFATRVALGASRGRVLRQVLTESVLLSLVGGGAGVLLAWLGTGWAPKLVPDGLPRVSEIQMDWRVLLFSFAVAFLAGIAFGVAPAVKLAGGAVQTGLAAASRRATVQRAGTQRGLVVAEVALSLVLLMGAGLMLRSLMKLWRADPGFDSHNVMLFGVRFPSSMAAAPPAAIRAEMRRLTDTLAATPGVEAASLRDGGLPMSGEDDVLFWRDGQPRPANDSDMDWTLRYLVQPGYLSVMKVPLLRGRFFNAQDTEKTPEVVVVDDVFAATFLPHEDALGKRIHWTPDGREAQIVGIVGHVKQWGLDNGANPLQAEIYQDIDQQPDDEIGINNGVILRTAGPPLAMVGTLKQALRGMNAETLLYDPERMDDIVEGTLTTRQFSMVLLGVFAGVALLLSAVGIFGVTAYLVGRRTQEFGIRMALGAQPGEVLRGVVGEAARLAGLGVLLGIFAAFGLTRLLQGMLFEVKPGDPATFGVAAALLIAVALWASYVPARRVLRIDPAESLRYE